MMGLARYVDRERDLQRNPWKRYLGKARPHPGVTVVIAEGLGREQRLTIVPVAQIFANLSASPPIVRIVKAAPQPDPYLEEELTRRVQEWNRKHG